MNSLYKKLMAEKGAPRAANNPNTTQLRSAPMNLRSAMNKYAEGGGVGSPPPSSGDINSFVQANIGNPQAIMQAAQQYGVSMDDLANATGYSSGQINDYFSNAGLGSMGTSSATSNAPYTDPNLTNEQLQSVGPSAPNPGEPNYEPPMTTSVPYNYGTAPESDYRAIDAAKLAAQNPPQVSSSSISPEVLKEIMKRAQDPFNSQINQQDELMKLLQMLKGK
jgi:hypothetical protein